MKGKMLSWVTNVGSLFCEWPRCDFRSCSRTKALLIYISPPIVANVGLGRHFILLGFDGMMQFVKMFWWCNACYNMSMAAIKLSLLFQYLRLLNEHSEIDTKPAKHLRIVVWTLITLTSIWGIIYTILAWVPCIPVSADWDFENTTAIRYGYGSDDKATFVATLMVHGAVNMAIDAAILVLPLFSKAMWIIAKRQKQSRIAMLFLFFLGLM